MLSIHHLLSFALICRSFTSDKTSEKYKISPNRDEILRQALQSYRFVCLSLAGGPIFSDVIWLQRYYEARKAMIHSFKSHGNILLFICLFNKSECNNREPREGQYHGRYDFGKKFTKFKFAIEHCFN